jgi:hypothetical protein
MRLACRTTGVSVAVAVALAAASAPASEPDPDWEERKPSWCCREEGSISAATLGVFTSGALVIADELELGPAVGAELPSTAADPYLDGIGWLAGAGIRTSFQSDDGWRVGGSFGAFELGGMSLVHAPLTEGYRMYLDRAVALQIAPFVGKAFEGYVVYPYIDAVLVFDVLFAEVKTRYDPLADTTETRMVGFSFDVMPRIGTLIPIDGDWYVDVGIQHGIHGIERIGGYLAVGTWDNI